MNKGLTMAIAAFLAAAGGCTSMANSEPVAAVMTEPSPAAMEEIKTIVSKALDGRKVRLAANSLMTENRLIIERAQIFRDGNPVMGRSYEKPDHFYLMKTADGCGLWHEETDTMHKLKSVTCKAVT